MAAAALAIGGIFGASGAAATAIGASVIGGVISGIGAGLSARAQSKAQSKRDAAERQAEIAEEKRRAGQYAGVGQTTRFWEKETPTAGGGIDPDYQRVMPQQYSAGVGEKTESQRFRTKDQAQRSRPFYNAETRRIQYS